MLQLILRFRSKPTEFNEKLAEGCSQVKSGITSDQCQDSNLNCSMEHLHAVCKFEEIRQDGYLDNTYWIVDLSFKPRKRRESTQKRF